MNLTRRALLALLPGLTLVRRLEAAPRLRITGIELLPVRATERTVWLFVRLKTDAGISGLGEASDAFGFANTSKQDATRMESEFRTFFQMVEGKSPLEVGIALERMNLNDLEALTDWMKR